MHQVLYRKWRPQTFAEMSGQEAVRRVLQREVESGQLAHAYLFCGTRGTGKTSAAKILAKAVNCLDPQQGNPCNQCELCRGIDDGSVLDVLEIDAASNNGVDSVREIREEVLFTPAVAKYRVYIIDEVHMLTSGAFNALLKTLEEPPAHVIFILATTELHKIPATILSRCQCFEFTRIPQEDMVQRLMQVAQGEGIELTVDAAQLIARLSDGALRNALSLLDQCAVSGQVVNAALVTGVGGLAGRDYLFDLSDALATKNNIAVLMAAKRIFDLSKEPQAVAVELLTHLRDLLLCNTVPKPEELLHAPPAEFDRLQQSAKGWTAGGLLTAIRTIQQALDAMSRSAQKKVLLELALLELSTPALSAAPEGLLARVEALERRVAEGIAIAPPAQLAAAEQSRTAVPEVVEAEELPPWLLDAPPPEPMQLEPEPEPDPLPEPKPAPLPEPVKAAPGAPAFWPDLVEAIDVTLRGFLADAGATLAGDTLTIHPAKGFAVRMLSKDSAVEEITAKLHQVTGQQYTLRIGAVESAEKPQENPLFDQLADRVERLNRLDDGGES